MARPRDRRRRGLPMAVRLPAIGVALVLILFGVANVVSELRHDDVAGGEAEHGTSNPTDRGSTASTVPPSTPSAPGSPGSSPGSTEAAPATEAPKGPHPVVAPRPAGPVAISGTPLLHRVPTDDRVVFLTIDDGAVRDPAVLEFLRLHQIPFSMFLTQPLAHEGLDYWKWAQVAGGVAETHSISHRNLTGLSGAQLRREICEPMATFEKLFGRRPTLFRPPYGSTNPAVLQTAAQCGYAAVLHWAGTVSEGHVALQKGHLSPGDILLVHWRPSLMDDLIALITRCEEEGFKIALIEHYLPPGR